MTGSAESTDWDEQDFDSIIVNATARDKEFRDGKAEAVKKAKAENPSKELFDAKKLKILYNYADTLHLGAEHDTEAVRADLEAKYYLDYPGIITIEDFAKKLQELDAYGAS